MLAGIVGALLSVPVLAFLNNAIRVLAVAMAGGFLVRSRLAAQRATCSSRGTRSAAADVQAWCGCTECRRLSERQVRHQPGKQRHPIAVGAPT